MKIVFAPDSFKGSAEAPAVAQALIDGWRSVRPGDECLAAPMADGGEGTASVLHRSVPGSELRRRTVLGPVGDPAPAYWLRLPDGSAVVELAVASGIELLGDRLHPTEADTFGFGELLADAVRSGATRIFAAIGGSSSSDGGAGLLSALGADLGDWKRIPGEHDATLAVDLAGLLTLPPGGVTVWSDVTNPLLGTGGAVAVFGPQKGATAELRPGLERRLTRIADALEDATQRPGLRDEAGSGAAGGAGFGLLAWGARLEQGAMAIAELIGLPEALEDADLVVTGEGRLDEQTESGKVAWAVGELARASATPLAIVAGSVSEKPGSFAGRAEIVSLTELAGSTDAAKADAAHWLREAGARLAGQLGS